MELIETCKTYEICGFSINFGCHNDGCGSLNKKC